MTRIGQFIFGVLLVILFFQVLIGFPIPLEQKTESPQLALSHSQIHKDREQVMGKIHLAESREGNRDWELLAEHAVGSEAEGVWHLEVVRAMFYADQQLEYVVTGNTGEIDTRTKNMRIEGSVVTKTANGYVFKTSRVDYEARGRVLSSPHLVEVWGPHEDEGSVLTMRGNSMEAKIDTDDIFLHEKVAAHKVFPNKRNFAIFSQQLKLSGKNFSALFWDQVRIEVDTLRIEGPKAEFEYLSKESQLKSILIQGGVKVSDMDKYATAETVRLEPIENRLTLTGRPRVVQGQDEIVGDQIMFAEGGKKVKVEKMRARVEESEN
ncbi:MAG: LPS export ABC transporter periplasmic protein LptC [Bdellovibrio sp.]|nr:MAG: LPS export ABC transporter periplasmic protein LptC [Bdellovibrio sp.]